MNARFAVRLLPVLGAAGALLSIPAAASAQIELCEPAERYVREVVGMVAITEPDTIDDWRTQAMVPGCRVTAAAAARRPVRDAARAFYEKILDDGWVRTPDPRDAPNEASMRFRKDGADCLFNYYDNSMTLNTDAEMTVTDAVHVGAGEAVYNFLVMCTPAMPAAPRGVSTDHGDRVAAEAPRVDTVAARRLAGSVLDALHPQLRR